jgi:hypothetical protein
MQLRAICGVRIALAVLAMAGVCLASSPQQPAGNNAAPPATVTFKLNFPHSDPEDYSITIDTTGQAHYECTGSVAPGSDPDTYRSEFEASPETREKIFAWAKQARYFAGNIDSGNRKLAFTGTKTLTYHDAQHDSTARYDYSNSAPVRELTELFQGMAATLEYGRRLAYYHRYQKLALDDELKRMEAQAKNNELSEMQSVAPVLQQIIDDNSVLNMTRARAQELMQMGRASNLVAGHNAR